MTVKECVLGAAELLGVAETVRAYLDGESTEGEAETTALLRCFNTVENELALDYLPLHAEDELETQTGAIFYSELSRSAVRILRVLDETQTPMAFKLFPEYLKTASGRVKVRYTYTPAEKGIDGKSDFQTLVSPRLMAYGMASEYQLAVGAFEDSAVWDKKYKDAIKAAYRSVRGGRIASRRWV
ncbi:MAG: hypothetical protein IJB34_03080 [Clostridia bacterium]|nr:hypothetical protein [Clostridia bacterium]